MKLDNKIITEESSFFKKFLFFILVLFMGKGCNFFIDIDPRVNIVGTLFVLIPMALVIMKEKPYSMNNKKFFMFVLAYILWFLYHHIVDQEPPGYQGVRILSLFLIGFITVKYYGWHIAEYFEFFLVRLTLLALLLWGVEIVIGANTMGAIAPFENRMHTLCKSFGIFSVLIKFDATEAFLGLPRNCGFCWEPGQFASLIVLALTFHILRLGNKFYNDSNFIILILGLFSTFSTTGFVTFGLLLFLKTIFGKASMYRRIVYIVVLGTLFMGALNLPFMRDKIERQSDTTSFYTNSENVYIDETGYRTVERFEGVYLSWMNLMDSPWLGYGPNQANSVASKLFPMFIISNGNVNPLAMLGLLLGLPLFFSLQRIKQAKFMFRRQAKVYHFYSISVVFNKLQLHL